MTDAQRATLERLCRGYGVDFHEADYPVYPPESWMMPGWAEGWVGGLSQRGHTIYVGVSPEGGAFRRRALDSRR